MCELLFLLLLRNALLPLSVLLTLPTSQTTGCHEKLTCLGLVGPDSVIICLGLSVK